MADASGWAVPAEDTAEDGARDSELEKVAAQLFGLDPDGSRMAGALRLTIDMLLDGQHTGRYRWDQLHKTEKTHCGTLVEINLQREFGFAGGTDLDYSIAGVDVDCKFSQDLWKWMIPPEALGKLCLVLWASDEESRWCAGIVRAEASILGPGTNRDSKRTISAASRSAVRKLFWDAPLQENVLLKLPPASVRSIFSSGSGQQRLDELFRLAQHRIISRTVVATVAQQDDYMKRIRYNGGSRSRLQPEGIVIFGQYGSHQEAAGALGLPVPEKGESVSARLARYRPELHVGAVQASIDGGMWVLAGPGDPVEAAPVLRI